MSVQLGQEWVFTMSENQCSGWAGKCTVKSELKTVGGLPTTICRSNQVLQARQSGWAGGAIYLGGGMNCIQVFPIKALTM